MLRLNLLANPVHVNLENVYVHVYYRRLQPDKTRFNVVYSAVEGSNFKQMHKESGKRKQCPSYKVKVVPYLIQVFYPELIPVSRQSTRR